MSFSHLLYRIAHAFPGKVPALAALMEKNSTVLMHKLNPNRTSHEINAPEIEMLADFADGNLAIAEYFAAKAGGVVVLMPDVNCSDMALLDSFMSVIGELGEFSSMFQNAWADGHITPEEFQRLKKEASDVQSRMVALLSRIERLVEPPARGRHK
jgi:hypothetical protein